MTFKIFKNSKVIEIIEKLLFDNPLCYIAYERKEIRDKISSNDFDLLGSILFIIAFKGYINLEENINENVDDIIKIIYEISSNLRSKISKKWIRNKRILKTLLFDIPVLDETKEDTNEYIKFLINKLEKDKGLKAKYIPNVNELESIYNKLIDKIWNKELIENETIYKIVDNL